MTAADLEQKAERAVRRGELLVALEHFEAYLTQQPDDERIRSRMESVRSLLQPSELVSRRRNEPDEGEPAAQLTDAEEGELRASSGRFAEAAAAYRRAIAANPKSELLKERLEELLALANPAGRADLAGAEKLEAPAPTALNGARKARSDKAHAASFEPIDAPAAPELPRERKELLEELLHRVRAGRRTA